MIAKERLSAITNLNLAGKIEDMNDDQMQQYEQLLITFIENFPGDEEKIKALLHEKLNEKRNFEELAKGLLAMCIILEKIHADDIAAECRNQINELRKAQREQVDAYVITFLSTVAMLSIDIQMAKYLEEKKYAEKKGNGAAETTLKAEDQTAAQPMAVKKADSEKIILAVDDTAIALSMLKKNLEGSPYKLVCINSGREAMLFLKKHQPDLFILDIEMPKMDGYELAEQIRKSGNTAPIIFLTGNATRRNVMRAIEAGASDFIVKPIDNRFFAYKIRRVL